ncbi:[FeFe] hydrogenase H-cluster radical SAM maturase HydE [Solibaculum mannosilyticum]|uniref:[FeFe] hydrogenase H-cluster radical SAM maturase HydE n=1 Tax=Solibaculum mannosilyticum TaxID=2780922 RepID=UPI0034C155F6
MDITTQGLRSMDHGQLVRLIEEQSHSPDPAILEAARSIRDSIYGRKVYFRGLIEISNHCKNDCYYCGIRRDNRQVSRYRLTKDQILHCCRLGHSLGFHTFVLQGGEDPWFTAQRVADLVASIKEEFPDCAVTLSLGEKEEEEYRAYRDAGADRYLLRHETADDIHYRHLHPHEMSPGHRKQCLWTLKRLGFQVGAGVMIGSPGQTANELAQDLLFLKELHPHMVGIGPFIPHEDTPFRDKPAGSIPQTILMLALTRILLPHVLLPATTALGSLDPMGREKGMDAGANVVMPNLSPTDVRQLYTLYNGKLSTGEEAAEGLKALKQRIRAAGYEPDLSRGDYKV